MKISDLKPKVEIDRIELEIVEIGEVRDFASFRGSGKVANAKVKDETGESILTLWNEQIEQVSNAKKVVVENGFVNVFKGKLQITTGKKGTLKVIE